MDDPGPHWCSLEQKIGRSRAGTGVDVPLSLLSGYVTCRCVGAQSAKEASLVPGYIRWTRHRGAQRHGIVGAPVHGWWTKLRALESWEVLGFVSECVTKAGSPSDVTRQATAQVSGKAQWTSVHGR